MTGSTVTAGTYSFAASYGQERLWFLNELEPESAVAYHLPTLIRVRGDLGPVRLQRAVDALLARHESLRTGVSLVDGQLRQTVLVSAVIAVPFVDLGGDDPASQEEAVQAEIRTEVRRPFDLSSPPLLRVKVLRLSPREHIICIVLHHIVCDGWSVNLLLRDLVAAYDDPAALGAGVGPARLQYADYADWERRTLEDGADESLIRYWRDHLRGVPPLNVPTDHPRPAVRSAGGQVRSSRLPTRVLQGLRRFGATHDATLFMVLLTCLGKALGTFARQDDLAIGTVVANRPRADLEDIVGLFANTLALRTDLAGGPGPVELVRRVRRTCVDAYAHQALPFERVVQAVAPARDLSRSPLFQTVLLLQNAPEALAARSGVVFEPLPVDNGSTKFDLTLEAMVDGDGLDLALHFSTRLWDAGTMEQLLGYFTSVATAVAERGEWPVEALPSPDVDAVPVPSAPEAEDRRPGLVHELVTRQAARTPRAIAVESTVDRLTYEELMVRVHRLSRSLIDHGVVPGDVVGVCSERSPALVVSTLAVLESGGAYLPIDPTLPGDRIRWMLEDVGATAVLTTAATAAGLPDGGWRALRVDAEAPAGPAAPAERRAVPDAPAYVIYTSGSTGRAKGVLVGHASLVNVLWSVAGTIGATADDVTAAIATSSFDIAALELLLPLITGGRTVIVAEDETADGHLLAETLTRHAVTIVQATPATWRLLVLAGWRPGPAVRLLSTGEALDSALAAELVSLAPGRLWNLYGPTEATLYASVGPIADADRVSLGRPVDHTTMLLLDDRLQLVPDGATGELYLGGLGLAYGYLGAPALTASRFLPDPFAPVAGRRLYRTSDLCRRRADGGLEFLGRNDDQIKIRGYRVEPGEVETVLRSHPAVEQAVVIARVLDPGDVRLNAYVLTREPSPALAHELRRLVESQLPAYMVPAAFAFPSVLPLTLSGKVDRTALRSLDLAAPSLDDRDDTAPRTELEERVAAAFCELLGLASVGIRSGFFELGGHSLLAARLVTRLWQETGVRLRFRDFFQAPTVADVAERIAAEGRRRMTPVVTDEALAVIEALPEYELDALLKQHGVQSF